MGKRCEHCEGRGHADADNPSSLPIIQEVAGPKQFAECVQHCSGVDRSALGKCDAAAAALNELDAKMSLKRSNLMTDRRGREVQASEASLTLPERATASKSRRLARRGGRVVHSTFEMSPVQNP